MIIGYVTDGFESVLVSIEVDIARTLPSLEIVGLPANEVKESRERIKTALRNNGFFWPNKKVLVNLAPSDIKKHGAGLDLPIALAILCKTKQIPEFATPTMVLGELQLNGIVRPVRNVVMAVIHAMKNDIHNYVLPTQNENDVAFSKSGKFIILSKLSDIHKFFDADKSLYKWSKEFVGLQKPKHTEESMYVNGTVYNFERSSTSLSQLSYCDNLKRSIQIAAAGKHNILLCGAPGTGKSAAAIRVNTFIPTLTYEQSLELSSIYANVGSGNTVINKGLITNAPIRQPHHSASAEAMVGSASATTCSMGEVSLAHMGVLILDEAPEFKAKVLQALREPLDSQHIQVSRVGEKKQYPANFLLILTCNLCPCGNLGKKKFDEDISGTNMSNNIMEIDNSLEYTWQNATICMCSEKEIFRYWKRIGGALWDRIDIKFTTAYRQFDGEEPESDRLKDIDTKRKQVLNALERQKERFKNTKYKHNGRCNDIGIFEISKDASCKIIQTLKFGVSDRERVSLYRVSRTIADLADEDYVSTAHVDEALLFTKNKIM